LRPWDRKYLVKRLQQFLFKFSRRPCRVAARGSHLSNERFFENENLILLAIFTRLDGVCDLQRRRVGGGRSH
jgi:hypothetical protein